MIIALDGPSGTGKSTVARELAKRLGFSFFDTGSMYRCVAWKLLDEEIDPGDELQVNALMARFSYEIQEGKERRYFVNGRDVTDYIRTQTISAVSSQIATYPEVRKALVQIQRRFGLSCNAVFEGRDMGTVVFPHADLKIFLTARPEVRALRRYQELVSKNPNGADSFQYNQILEETIQRDKNDSTRALSPLKQAVDAICIDTSNLSIQQVVEQIVQMVLSKNRDFPKMKPFYFFIYSLARFFFKTFYGLKIYGLEHFKKGSGIIAANHVSNFDPPVLSISCPEEVHFLGKESLFRIPGLSWVIKKLNTHPIAGAAADLATLKKMVQILNQGHKLIVFPEGSRSFDGALQPHERGVAFLAQSAKCPIFPAYLKGTFEAWPRQKKIPKLFGEITCVFGSPIYPHEYEGVSKKEAQEQIRKRCECAIEGLKNWVDQGAIGTPP